MLYSKLLWPLALAAMAQALGTCSKRSFSGEFLEDQAFQMGDTDIIVKHSDLLARTPAAKEAMLKYASAWNSTSAVMLGNPEHADSDDAGNDLSKRSTGINIRLYRLSYSNCPKATNFNSQYYQSINPIQCYYFYAHNMQSVYVSAEGVYYYAWLPFLYDQETGNQCGEAQTDDYVYNENTCKEGPYSGCAAIRLRAVYCEPECSSTLCCSYCIPCSNDSSCGSSS